MAIYVSLHIRLLLGWQKENTSLNIQNARGKKKCFSLLFLWQSLLIETLITTTKALEKKPATQKKQKLANKSVFNEVFLDAIHRLQSWSVSSFRATRPTSAAERSCDFWDRICLLAGANIINPAAHKWMMHVCTLQQLLTSQPSILRPH